MLSVGLFTFTADPWGVFRPKPEGYASLNERFTKPTLWKNNKAPCLIIGSSKTAYISGMPACLNMSISGLYPEEILYLFKSDNIKNFDEVFLGIDLIMFNKNRDGGTKLNETREIKNLFLYLYDYKAIKDSIKILISSFRPLNILINSDGSRNYKFAKISNLEYEKRTKIIFNMYFKDYVVSDKRIEYLQDVLEIAKTKNIKLFLFINPESEDLVNYINKSGALEQLNVVRQKIKKIEPQILDFSCSKSFSNRRHFPDDPLHYTSHFGTTMLKFIAKNKNEIIDSNLCLN
jgi:hypothetical protein